MKVFATLLFVAALIGGCDPLTDLINEKWPPVTADQQRDAAIESTAKNLRQLEAPNIALSVSFSDLNKVLNSPELQARGVAKVEVEGDRQLARVTVKFERAFSEADGADDTQRQMLKVLKPTVAGTVTVFAGISANLSGGDSNPQLEVKLLPAVSRISVDKLIVASSHDAKTLVEPLVALLNKYRDNISGELSRSSVTRVTVPALAAQSFDPTQLIRITEGANVEVKVTGRPVNVAFRLSGLAWLVESAHLMIVSEIVPKSSPAPKTLTSAELPATYDAIRKQVRGIVNERFGLDPSSPATWAAVRKDVVALNLSTALTQANACMAVNGRSQKQSASSKIPLPDGSKIKCEVNRECASTRSCDFSASKDTRDCNACLIWKPRVCILGRCAGGGCGLRGNDPVCEASKATQNTLYQADAAAKKLDCENIKARDKASCEFEKAGQKALCEAGKGTLQALKKTGNFGNLDVDSTVYTDGFEVCLKSINLSPDLGKVDIKLQAKGSAKADIWMKFTPLDVAGHLTCQAPFTNKRTFNAKLREEAVSISSTISMRTSDQKPAMDFQLREVELKTQIAPSPIEYLLTNVNMTLACQGLNLIKPLLVAATPFSSELKGDINYKSKPARGSIPLNLPVQDVGGKKLKLRADSSVTALIVHGEISSQ